MAEGKKKLSCEAETMGLEDGFDVLDMLVGCLSQSEEWRRIQMRDALIQKAEDTLYQQLEQIKSISSEDCALDLESAISTYTNTRDDAAILFGLRMAVRMFHAFGRPLEMSRHLLAQDEKKKVGVCYGGTI